MILPVCLAMMAASVLATDTTTLAYQLLRRQDYADTVCSPNITVTPGTTIPPCIEIQTIEQACAPNGTDPIDFEAHAQCLCGGSYFAEWTGCQDCLYFHGQRTQDEEAFYESVASAASQSLCGFLSTGSAAAATPTTDFAGYFSMIEPTLAPPATGATVSSDQAPGQTEVSLYFTLSGSQGPGVITGSAASATATGTSAASGEGGGSSGSGSGSRTSAGSGSSGSSSASSGRASSSSSSADAAALTRVTAGGLYLGGLYLGIGIAVMMGP